jgi:beta-carotene 3-hydroxylase
MIMIWNIAIVLVTFVLMEGITWLTHKYVMHGFLWSLHRDHHHKDHEHPLEKNDYFFLIFALPAIAMIMYGIESEWNYWFYIGVGVTLYGIAYFFVHDIFIHQRIKIFRKAERPYFLGMRRAHKQHHKHTGKENGECFGFLWVPLKYIKMYAAKNK